jgi:hypothetical protein
MLLEAMDNKQLGADHLNFEWCYSEQKNTCNNKLGGKYLASVFGGKFAGIDLISPRRSAGLIFRD